MTTATEVQLRRLPSFIDSFDAVCYNSNRRDKFTRRRTEDTMARIIKRYSNRKLYDTEVSHYVSLQDIIKLVRADEDVQVTDSRTGEDLTSVILAQAMAEEEKSEGSVFSQDTLKELIKRGSESLDEILRTSRLIRKGAIQMAEEGATKYYRKLVDHGEIGEDEAQSLLRQLSRTVTKRRHSLRREIDERVAEFVETMHLPSRSDVERIGKKIDAIAAKLDTHIGSRSRGKSRRRKKQEG
jgi:polyhydroxyalkanoate synthesis repressor PhaR